MDYPCSRWQNEAAMRNYLQTQRMQPKYAMIRKLRSLNITGTANNVVFSSFWSFCVNLKI